MKPPRYSVEHDTQNQPGCPGWAWVIDTQSRGDWGEPLRVFLVTPACAAQDHCDRLNAADQREETDP